MICKTPLSWRFCGSRYAYIYAIYSVEHKLCYIGQTNDSIGIIGRLSCHLSNGGTFRNHFENITGLLLEDVSDLLIVSENLTELDIFLSSSSAYREGVEYLVKKYTMELISKENIFIRLIGNTRPLSTNSLSLIKKEAKVIASMIFLEIKKDYINSQNVFSNK